MTTLTLDHAKSILFSSANAFAAFSALSEFSCEIKCIGTTHFLYIDTHVIMFFDGPATDTLWIFIDGSLVRQPNLLESQQQPTDTVPAASTVAEARPEFHPTRTCFCPACDYDQATAQKDLEAEFFHVNCSQCGLDADRDPLELCLSFDPDTEFHNLIGLFKVLGNVATRDESYQRVFVNNLLNNSHIHLHHLFDASLWMCVDAQLDTLDQIAPAHLKAGE